MYRKQHKTEIEVKIGAYIRHLRKSKKLTLDRLAEETALSKGYISKIERGYKVPPISTLARIAQALEVELNELFNNSLGSNSSSSGKVSLVKVNERQKILRGGSSFGYDYQTLAHKITSKQMQPFLLTFPSQLLKEVYFEHEGEEMIFVLSGTVEFEAGGKRFMLTPGDCMYIDSSVPHRGRGVNEEAKALVVIYTPTDSATDSLP